MAEEAVTIESSKGGAPSSSLSSWMASLGTNPTLETTPKADEQTTEKPKGDVPPANGSSDASGKTVKPADKPADTAAAATAIAAAKEADEKAKADAARLAEDAPPKDKDDWEKFKTKHKGIEESLRGQITASEAKIKELEEARNELQSRFESGAADKTITDEIDRLKSENQTLTEKIAELNITEHPRFKSEYDDKIKSQIEAAKKIVGADHAADIERALKMADTPEFAELRQAILNDVIDGLNPLQVSRISIVMNEIDKISEKRSSDIQKAGEIKSRSAANIEAQRKAAMASKTKAFEDAAKAIAANNPAYQEQADNPKWNTEVKQRREIARRILTGEGMSMEDIARASLDAASVPAILSAYKSDMTEAQAKIATLEAQINSMRAAQPGGGGTTSGSAPVNGRVDIKPGMRPHEAAAAWAKSMHNAIRGD